MACYGLESEELVSDDVVKRDWWPLSDEAVWCVFLFRINGSVAPDSTIQAGRCFLGDGAGEGHSVGADPDTRWSRTELLTPLCEASRYACKFGPALLQKYAIVADGGDLGGFVQGDAGTVPNETYYLAAILDPLVSVGSPEFFYVAGGRAVADRLCSLLAKCYGGDEGPQFSYTRASQLDPDDRLLIDEELQTLDLLASELDWGVFEHTGLAYRDDAETRRLAEYCRRAAGWEDMIPKELGPPPPNLSVLVDELDELREQGAPDSYINEYEEWWLREAEKRTAPLPAGHVQAPQSPPRPMTDGQKRLWNALKNRALSAKELAGRDELDTSGETVRQWVLGLRKAGHAIEHRSGRGYYRPDAPPSEDNPPESD